MASGPRIQDATADFLQGGVSMIAASSDRNNRPVIARALGCRVSSNGREVFVLVPSSEPFLDAVRATARIAVTFTKPSTHHTIQLKGNDARITLPARPDAALSRRYADLFVAEVCPLGYTEELIRAMLTHDSPELARVTFSPAAAFVQTPGPRAGDPLGS